MTWNFPLAFLLFLPWMAAAWRVLRVGKRRAVPFAPLASIQQKTTWRQRLRVVAPLLFLAGLALLIVAAARPQTRSTRSRRSADLIAIQMVVDVSGSMEALDLSLRRGNSWDFKSRLDVVKELFSDFVERRSNDLIGLVTFGGYATTRSPLTLDHRALRHVLSAVQIPSQQDASTDQEELLTAIGDGLAMGCARLEQASNVVSRIIVMLSDGESNAGVVTPEEATRLAKKLGVKVYTIGVGTTGMAPFRGRDMFGREIISQSRVTMDEKELRRIAETTDGMYFGVQDRAGLDEALKKIDEMEKTAVDQTIYEDRHDHFMSWLASGLLLLFAAVTLAMTVERRIA